MVRMCGTFVYGDMLFDRHGDSYMVYSFICFQEEKRVSDVFLTAALVNIASK